MPGQPSTTPAAHGAGPWPYVAAGVGNGLDLATTLQRLRAGTGHEANPLLPTSSVGIAVTKSAETAALMALMHYWASHGHTKAAKVFGYLDGAGTGALALHNATGAK